MEPAFHGSLTRVLVSLAIIIAVTTIRSLFIRQYIQRNRSSSVVRLNKNSTYIAITTVMVLLFFIWLPALGNILALFSILGAGVVIVHKEVILNFSGWLYILIRRPFEPGNRIRIGNAIGDVIDIRFLDFSMIEVRAREDGGQSTGRIIRVPNSLLFTQSLANASMEFTYYWNEIAVKLTPASDWKKALAILEKIADEMADQIRENDPGITAAESMYAIHYRSIKPRIYVEYKNGGIYLNLRHLTEPRKAREDSDKLWREILTRFSREKKIELSTE